MPVLYGKPQRYANFLGQEIVYYYKGPLLVVMPNGYGIYQGRRPRSPRTRSCSRGSPPPGSTDGNALAVGRERRAGARPQPRDHAATAGRAESGSSSNRDRLAIVGAVILLCIVGLVLRLVQRRRRRGALDSP